LSGDEIIEQDLGNECVRGFRVAAAKKVPAEDEGQDAGEEQAGIHQRGSDDRIGDTVAGDLTAFCFEGIPLMADLGSFGLQIAMQARELGSRLSVGFDELAAPFGDFLLQFCHPAVLLGLSLGSTFRELGEAFIAGTTAGAYEQKSEDWQASL
jgi:hypothetical protein